MRDILVTIRDLRLDIKGSTVLNIRQLEIERKAILVLYGPNGAGKSTLLRVLSLVEKPHHGEVRFLGRDRAATFKSLDLRRKIALLLQQPTLFDTTVRNNICYGMKVRGMRRTVIDERVAQIAETLKIEHLLSRNARELSGGESHRVSLARALIIEPELLLLDEPLSSLDLPSREGFWEELRDIIKSRFITAVYVTHDRIEAQAIGDRIAIIDGGEILQEGPLGEVFNNPLSEKVASLVGIDAMTPGRVVAFAENVLYVQIGQTIIRSARSEGLLGDVLVCVRPERVLLHREKYEEYRGAINDLRGKITSINSLGPLCRIHIDAGIRLNAYITSGAFDEMVLKEGEEIYAYFPASATHVISQERRPVKAEESLLSFTRAGVGKESILRRPFYVDTL
jgi:tungstate transport system ATP-binding protein